MNQTLLSIDCGTQSLRALLFSHDGRLLKRVQVEYEPYYSRKPGWAEQDPELYWRSVCKACQALSRTEPESFAAVAGVGVTTQRSSMVNVDRDGAALRPVIIWLDHRKAGPVYFPNPLVQLAYKAVGMEEVIARVQAQAKCNWIKQNEPHIWDETYKYLQISGFLNHRLTGLFKDSTASQIGHIPFNYRKLKWAGPGEMSALLCPIEQDKLPEIAAPGEQIGEITDKAHRETGIPKGTPVIACGSDKGCETLGMGVLDKRMASLSFGTTATVQTTTENYCEPIRFMPAYPAPIPGKYNPEVEIFRGYWMITWFKNEFAHGEIREAAEQGVPPEILLNRLLETVPPGSMGLVVQPYWSPGFKNPAAKGAMIGFGDVHKRAHVYRAVIEGLGYALLDGLHKIEKAAGAKIEKAAVSGGASQSDEICRITADIFNIPMVRGGTYETSGLGAAIVTSVGCGVHSSFDRAIDQMVHYDTEFEPNPDNVKIYADLFHRVYQKIYPALEPIYQEIRDITGYPEKY